MDRRIRLERKKLSLFMEIVSMWERKHLEVNYWVIEFVSKRIDERFPYLKLNRRSYCKCLKEKYETENKKQTQ